MMSERWDGRPLNPERRWVHAIRVGEDVWLSQWEPDTEEWDFGNSGCIIGEAEFAEHCAQEGYQYLGPYFTPAEVVALLTARESLEAITRYRAMLAAAQEDSTDA